MNANHDDQLVPHDGEIEGLDEPMSGVIVESGHPAECPSIMDYSDPPWSALESAEMMFGTTLIITAAFTPLLWRSSPVMTLTFAAVLLVVGGLCVYDAYRRYITRSAAD